MDPKTAVHMALRGWAKALTSRALRSHLSPDKFRSFAEPEQNALLGEASNRIAAADREKADA